jgi:GntR family transcriptional regulator
MSGARARCPRSYRAVGTGKPVSRVPLMTQHDAPRFPPRGRKLVYVAIADVLAARIKDGTYPPDGRLPAELDLVAEFGSSRESVRRAVDELRKRGLIETVRGKGSFVTRPEERASDQRGAGD